MSTAERDATQELDFDDPELVALMHELAYSVADLPKGHVQMLLRRLAGVGCDRCNDVAQALWAWWRNARPVADRLDREADQASEQPDDVDGGP
jgi:hypothetical protein